MRNERGSVLVLTLIIFVALMMLGMSALDLAVNENKQAIYHQNRKQAYYIARSGAVIVEAAILAMNEEEIKKLDQKLDEGELIIGEIDINGEKINVVLNKDGNKLFIESVGSIGKVPERITKVMEKEIISICETIEVNKSVFSNNDMIVKGGTIEGDIGTNSNIKIEGWPIINGNAYLMEGKSITATNDQWLIQRWSDDRNKKLDSEAIYPSPIIPNYFEDDELTNISEFPKYDNYPNNLPLSPDLEFSENSNEIIENSRYKKISVPSSKVLYINAINKDINIWTEELICNGQIIVNGGHNVNIHIKSKFSTNTDNDESPIIVNNPVAKINIYFSGNGEDFNTNNSEGGINANLYLNPIGTGIDIKNSQVYGNIYVYRGKFSVSGGAPEPRIKGNIYSKLGNVEIPNGDVVGNIYIDKGNFEKTYSGYVTGNLYLDKGSIELGGSGSINGSIITNADEINISGAGKITEGLIYAPNAYVSILDGGSIKGAIIANKFFMSGGAKIEFKPEYIDTDLINVESATSSSSSSSYKSGYFK